MGKALMTGLFVVVVMLIVTALQFAFDKSFTEAALTVVICILCEQTVNRIMGSENDR